MSRRRLLLLGVGVTALLALAGIASHGRPLAPTRGGGPTVAFWEYLFTTVVICMVVVLALAAYALLAERPSRPWQPRHPRWYFLSSAISIALSAAVAYYLIHHGFLERLRAFEQKHLGGKHGRIAGSKAHVGAGGRNVHIRWGEVIVVAVLIAGAAAFLYATRRTRRALPRRRLRSHEAMSLALDESLDDLRSDPDLRRAIIAAYARMERALAQAGVPRRPSEAPLEYLERALRGLETSAPAVRRLTDLFEWAKFSHHEPEPEMRDEAIDALVALRDELRRPEAAAVA